jgi:hypothetical protein
MSLGKWLKMNKAIILKIIFLLTILYGILLYNSYILNIWWPDYVEKTEDKGIEFVAMTRNDTPSTFPDLEISHEYRLYAKRKWHYPYDKLLDDNFFFDNDSIPSSIFVPYTKVFDLDRMKYVAIFEKILDKDFYNNHGNVRLIERMSKIVIFDSLQRNSKGIYRGWNIDGFNCSIDSALSVSKNLMMNVKTVLLKLDQDTSCIRDIIDCFPDYACNTIQARKDHGYSGK